MPTRNWMGDISPLKTKFAAIQTEYRKILHSQIDTVYKEQLQVSKRIQEVEKNTVATQGTVNKQIKKIDGDSLLELVAELEVSLQDLRNVSDDCFQCISRIEAHRNSH